MACMTFCFTLGAQRIRREQTAERLRALPLRYCFLQLELVVLGMFMFIVPADSALRWERDDCAT
jgi:hypothetical protein